MIDLQTLGPPPRRARPKEDYLAERNGAVALLAMLLIGAGCMAWSYAEGQRHLMERGIEERGTVVREWYTSGKGAGYHVEVAYPSGADSVTKRFDVGPGFYQGEREGDSVTVKMDPREPRNAALYGLSDAAARDHIRNAYGGLASALALVALGFLLDAWDARRQRRILETWLPGVLSVERVRRYDQRFVHSLVWGTATDDQGRTRRARRLPCATVPPVGATLPVLCDPDSDGVATAVMLGKVEALP